MHQGKLQVYTGSGKGKTTAAAGLAARALGHGLRVLWVRMLKSAGHGGELLSLLDLPGFRLLDAGVGVIKERSSAQLVSESVQRVFNLARNEILASAADLVVFDEINGAIHRNSLHLDDLLSLLDSRPSTVEIVLTGRYAHPAVVARADLVTEMTELKHPFKRGIAARRGIEY